MTEPKTWDFEPDTLDAHYDELIEALQAQIDKFDRRRRRYKVPTRLIRFGALFAAVAGVMLPLLVGPGKLFCNHHDGVELGYIAFAFGAMILLGDQVFACTSSWSRCRVAELQLVGLRNELKHDWVRERPALKGPEDTAQVHVLLELLKSCQAKAHLVNESQMKMWFAELEEGRDAVSAKIARP